MMTDIAVERTEKGRVTRDEKSEAPAWPEQRVDGFHGGLVIGDVLEDVDAQRRVERVISQRLDRLRQVIPADDDVGAIPIAFACCADILVDDVNPDHQLAVDQEAGNGARAATDLEDPLAETVPDAVEGPAVISMGAFHDLERRRAGAEVHQAGPTSQTNTPAS